MPQPSLGKSRSSCQKAQQRGNGRETHIHRARKAAVLCSRERDSRGPGEPHCNWTGGGEGERGVSRRKLGNTTLPEEHGIPDSPWIWVLKFNVTPASSPGTYAFLDGSKILHILPRGNLTKELRQHRRGGPGPRAKSQSRFWVTFPTAPPGPRPQPHPYPRPLRSPTAGLMLTPQTESEPTHAESEPRPGSPDHP